MSQYSGEGASPVASPSLRQAWRSPPKRHATLRDGAAQPSVTPLHAERHSTESLLISPHVLMLPTARLVADDEAILGSSLDLEESALSSPANRNATGSPLQRSPLKTPNSTGGSAPYQPAAGTGAVARALRGAEGTGLAVDHVHQHHQGHHDPQQEVGPPSDAAEAGQTSAASQSTSPHEAQATAEEGTGEDKGDEAELECRVCRGPAEEGSPLFEPCKCSGSIRAVHQDCLSEWLRVSAKQRCELCGARFRWHKSYAAGAPRRLPLHQLVAGAFRRGLRATPNALCFLMWCVAWGVVVPLVTGLFSRFFFCRTSTDVDGVLNGYDIRTLWATSATAYPALTANTGELAALSLLARIVRLVPRIVAVGLEWANNCVVHGYLVWGFLWTAALFALEFAKLLWRGAAGVIDVAKLLWYGAGRLLNTGRRANARHRGAFFPPPPPLRPNPAAAAREDEPEAAADAAAGGADADVDADVGGVAGDQGLPAIQANNEAVVDAGAHPRQPAWMDAMDVDDLVVDGDVGVQAFVDAADLPPARRALHTLRSVTRILTLNIALVVLLQAGTFTMGLRGMSALRLTAAFNGRYAAAVGLPPLPTGAAIDSDTSMGPSASSADEGSHSAGQSSVADAEDVVLDAEWRRAGPLDVVAVLVGMSEDPAASALKVRNNSIDGRNRGSNLGTRSSRGTIVSQHELDALTVQWLYGVAFEAIRERTEAGLVALGVTGRQQFSTATTSTSEVWHDVPWAVYWGSGPQGGLPKPSNREDMDAARKGNTPHSRTTTDRLDLSIPDVLVLGTVLSIGAVLVVGSVTVATGALLGAIVGGLLLVVITQDICAWLRRPTAPVHGGRHGALHSDHIVARGDSVNEVAADADEQAVEPRPRPAAIGRAPGVATALHRAVVGPALGVGLMSALWVIDLVIAPEIVGWCVDLSMGPLLGTDWSYRASQFRKSPVASLIAHNLVGTGFRELMLLCVFPVVKRRVPPRHLPPVVLGGDVLVNAESLGALARNVATQFVAATIVCLIFVAGPAIVVEAAWPDIVPLKLLEWPHFLVAQLLVLSLALMFPRDGVANALRGTWIAIAVALALEDHVLTTADQAAAGPIGDAGAEEGEEGRDAAAARLAQRRSFLSRPVRRLVNTLGARCRVSSPVQVRAIALGIFWSSVSTFSVASLGIAAPAACGRFLLSYLVDAGLPTSVAGDTVAMLLGYHVVCVGLHVAISVGEVAREMVGLPQIGAAMMWRIFHWVAYAFLAALWLCLMYLWQCAAMVVVVVLVLPDESRPIVFFVSSFGEFSAAVVVGHTLIRGVAAGVFGNTALKRSLRTFVNRGVARTPPMWVLRNIIFPFMFPLLRVLCFPLVLVRYVAPVFGFSALGQGVLLRFAFAWWTLAEFGFLVLMLLWRLAVRVHNDVHEERYGLGRTLLNRGQAA